MIYPLVSIITVNYNQPEITSALLRSIMLLEYPNWEMIVVDNASPQCSSAKLKLEFPFITHISSPVNIGFAGGNNIGLYYARGSYVFFINNDTEVTPTLVTILVQYLQAHPDCGLACPKIKYFNSPQIIQYAGAIGLHPITSRSVDIGYLQKDYGQFNDTRITDLPNGAAMMVSREVLEKVGPMKEIYFLYYEELDWAKTFQKAGYFIHYVGTAEIFHKESISTGKNSPLKTFYLFRNRLLYIRRNYSGIKKTIAATFFLSVSIPIHLIKHCAKKELSHAKAIGKAVMWHCTHRPFDESFLHSATIINQSIII